jgi:hypothetical protein
MNKKITSTVQNYFSNLNRIKFSSTGHNLLKEQHMQFQENLDNYFKNFDINSISESVSGTLLGKIVAGSHTDLVGENIYSVQYNLYLSSLITHFESFFRDLFVELVNYEFSDCIKVLNFSKKFTFEEIDLYKEEKITKGEIISQNYKFQNLDSVRKAYELIGFDFFKLLDLENGRIDKIRGILGKRHSIVHGGKSSPVSDFKEIDGLSTFFYKLGVDVVTVWLSELDKK